MEVRLSCRLFLGAVFGLCVGGAGADVTVYNNFTGPDHDGWDYNWGLGWTVAGADSGNPFGVEQAIAFTPSDSGPLAHIWVPIWRVPFDAGADEVTVRLVRNPNNQPPVMGDVLEAWTLNSFATWSDWSPPHDLESLTQPLLQAGESYWIWMEGTNTTWCGWAMNSDPALTLPHTLRREGENWLPIANETAGALRVDVVPEPVSLLLVLSGALLLYRRR